MKTLYIIHGWTYSVKPWEKTLKLLEKKGIKTKMLNVPGLTEPSEKIWSIDDYVSWADKNLPDKAVVLGHSNGGRILLNLLSKNPKKLSHVILLDSAGIFEPSKKKVLIEKIAKLGTPLKKNVFINKAFHKLTGSTDYSHAPENMKRTLENMLESDKTLNLENIDTKVSILWGKNDKITPPRHAEKLHAALKNSSLTFFYSWTHAPYISNPEELANAISKVIEEKN